MRWTVASLALAIAAVVFLLNYPVYSGFSGGRPARATLLEVNGAWAVVPMMFPVLVAALAVAIPGRGVRIGAAVVLGIFSFIGGFTVGMFYVPSFFAMVVAAALTRTSRSQAAMNSR
jgi:hypothetical protein